MIAPLFYVSAMIVITVLISLLIGYYMKTKNQERLRMIDKGINPDGELSISEYRKQTSLKNGILALSLGIGLAIGHVLVISIDKLDNFLTYVIMLLIFGGIGFLINYSVIKRSGEK
ncbi:MAG: hypothetical protein AMS27_14090 [Bacteroides sp. SM23_62_1]|nr:MAG: hypothetical protein AMS27_14090 [Bacteroides sp. SM23_62_1]